MIRWIRAYRAWIQRLNERPANRLAAVFACVTYLVVAASALFGSTLIGPRLGWIVLSAALALWIGVCARIATLLAPYKSVRDWERAETDWEDNG